MAQTFSKMIALESLAHDFRLKNVVSGQFQHLDSLRGEKGTLVMFICNHCPYVKRIENQLLKFTKEYIKKGIAFIAISSNDALSYPEDAPEKMREKALMREYPFPYLYDETQEVAKRYEATCTPDFFLYDKELKLKYRGQFDDSRPGNALPITGKDLGFALDCVLQKKVNKHLQKPSIGCSIKWK